MRLGDGLERRAVDAAQREVGHEHDALSFAVVDLLVVLALGEAVVVLDGGDRENGASPFDLRDADVGDADVSDLARVLRLLDGAQALLERRLGIDSVEVVEGDRVGPQALQALVDLGFEYVGATLAGRIAAFGTDDGF